MRFEFSGTVEEIEKFLICEYSYSKRAAQIASIILVYDKLESKEIVKDIDFANNNKFLKPIGDSRFDLTLTDVKAVLMNSVVETVIAYCFTKDLSTIPIWFFSAMTKIIKYIEDSYCCIYYAAIKWKAKPYNKLKRFRVEDIRKIISDNKGYCIHIEKLNDTHFSCPFYINESCNLIANSNSDAFIEKQLNDLCEKKVLGVIDGTYDFLD